jgi:hypothetical protein
MTGNDMSGIVRQLCLNASSRMKLEHDEIQQFSKLSSSSLPRKVIPWTAKASSRSKNWIGELGIW